MSEIGRRREHRTLFHRPAIRGAMLAVGVAVVALALLSVLDVFGAGGPSIVEKAQAALAVPGNAILHFKTSGSQDNGDGTTVSWSDESWQLSSAPYTMRRVEIVSDGGSVETGGDQSGLRQLYDPESNTIYQIQDSQGSGQQDGTVQSEFQSFRDTALEVLDSGTAKVEEGIAINGREAVRITSADGSKIYIIDAETSDPIEWQTKGDGGGTTLQITLEKLPATPENAKLADLTAQYPDATVDTDPAHYEDASSKAFPKG